MQQIQDYYRYTELMRNGFYDKLFFIDKLFGDWKTFMDYGCADGFSTKILANIFPDKYIIGYDEDPQMILRARVNGSMPGNVKFTTIVNEVCDVLFLSSVTHEVHSYKTMEEVKEFWNIVFNPKRKYVIIRDMVRPDNILHNIGTYVRAVQAYCLRMGLSGQLERFEQIFGTITRPEHLVHFMMKYLYIDSPNWNREIIEHYHSVGTGILTHKGYVPPNWSVEYKELYTLPYLKHRWREDFQITDFPITTHGKYIFRNETLK